MRACVRACYQQTRCSLYHGSGAPHAYQINSPTQGSIFSVKTHLFSVQFSLSLKIFRFLNGGKNSGREHILFSENFRIYFQIYFLCAEPYTTCLMKPGKPPSCRWDRHHSSKAITSRQRRSRVRLRCVTPDQCIVIGEVVISTTMGRWLVGDAVAILDAFSLVGARRVAATPLASPSLLVPPLPVK